MDKNNDMQQKKIADDELEQVGGGGKLWDLFTMEFRELFEDSEDPDLLRKAEEASNHYGVRTLEMRVDPNKKQNPRDPQKVLKI